MPKYLMTRGERALKFLPKNEKTIILQPDKGDGWVSMKKWEQRQIWIDIVS